MDKTKCVTFCGGMNRDLIVVSDKFPCEGETIVGSKFFTEFGGKAPNQAIMCKQLEKNNLRVAFIGKLGDDENGKAYEVYFKKSGIDTTGITMAEHGIPSGVASICVNGNSGANKIIIVPGANDYLLRIDIEMAESIIKDSMFLAISLESNMDGIQAALEIAKRHGVTTILNAAPAPVHVTDSFYELIDILCVNEVEAKILTERENCIRSTDDDKEIENMIGALITKCPTVIITLGDKGAALATSNDLKIKRINIPEIKHLEVVDTTGAGDAFLGSLVFFLSEIPDLTLEEVVRRACYVATITIQKPGAQSSYPKRSDLPQWLFEN